MAEEEKITLRDGKYEFYMQKDSLYCRRYGEEWRHFIGDTAIRSLFDLALTLLKENETMKINIANMEPRSSCRHPLDMD